MTAATLTIRPTGRCAPRDGIRPCQIRNPDWWTTGNAGNATAIELCRTACRYTDTCYTDSGFTDHERPVGVIVAGTPWNDWGKPIITCDRCGHPWHRRAGYGAATCLCPRTAADHADTIEKMRARRKSYHQIAKATGLARSTIRNYCIDKAVRERQNGTRVNPADYHDQIEAMRRDSVRWADIAVEIGCTHNALMSYVKRQREKGLIAA